MRNLQFSNQQTNVAYVINGNQVVVCWLYFRGQILYFWCFNVYMDMNLVNIKKRGKKVTDLSNTKAFFFLSGLLNAHNVETENDWVNSGSRCEPPPLRWYQHVCLRVFVCVYNSYLSFVQKKHPRILKHFGFCILKCFIPLFSAVFFYSFHSKLEIKCFFFLMNIFSWRHLSFSSIAQPSIVVLAAAWQHCTVQHTITVQSACRDGWREREREREQDLQPASEPTWTRLWNNFLGECVSCFEY